MCASPVLLLQAVRALLPHVGGPQQYTQEPVDVFPHRRQFGPCPVLALFSSLPSPCTGTPIIICGGGPVDLDALKASVARHGESETAKALDIAHQLVAAGYKPSVYPGKQAVLLFRLYKLQLSRLV